jgi:1,4-alpha-glucan branching enzyme
MKKTGSLDQKRIREARTAGVKKTTQPSKAAKPSPLREGRPVGLLEEHFPDSGAKAIRFEYFNPEAREVLVAGSFNNWQPQSMPMTKQRAGMWSTEILLPPGQYEYRFVVDGQWQDDPMAARFLANSFGGLNCVVEVKPAAVSPRGL